MTCTKIYSLIAASESPASGEILFGSPAVTNQTSLLFTPPVDSQTPNRTPASDFARLKVDYTPGVGIPKIMNQVSRSYYSSYVNSPV